ncbi:succinyl-CoA synthetase subunit beta [Marinobacter mangrovi]|uniref:succinyl-CoA synthetase subunit beta n=1 Tax=Marinobacter mangrovi TaxID=2803918 RepID=UPI001933DDA2|nr:succinyl-CoA synthetase subunit beta [Marinobacter mangrovi]
MLSRSNYHWPASVAALVLLPFFFVGGPDWSSGPLFKAAWNLGHIIFFTLFTLAVRPRRWLSGVWLWLACTAFVTGVGVIIELIQGNVGRDSDWHDIFRNLIGTWLVLAWGYRPPAITWRRALNWVLRLTAVVLLMMELQTVAAVAEQQYRIANQLPTLYNFDDPHPLHYWRGRVHRTKDNASDVDGFHHSLRMDLLGINLYSGASLDNLPEDWRGYEALDVVLYNPDSTPLDMTIRVNDIVHDRGHGVYSDRFNKRLHVKPGLNRFHIPMSDIRNAPKTRTMDMDEIRRLVIFTTHLKQPRSIYIVRLALD